MNHIVIICLGALSGLAATILFSFVAEILVRRKGNTREVFIMNAVNELEDFRIKAAVRTPKTESWSKLQAEAMNFFMSVESEKQARQFLESISKVAEETDPKFLEFSRKIIDRRFPPADAPSGKLSVSASG